MKMYQDDDRSLHHKNIKGTDLTLHFLAYVTCNMIESALKMTRRLLDYIY